MIRLGARLTVFGNIMFEVEEKSLVFRAAKAATKDSNISRKE